MRGKVIEQQHPCSTPSFLIPSPQLSTKNPAMSLPALPNEILLRIAWYLPKCATCHCRHGSRDLSALSRCSRHLHCVLGPELACTASAPHMLLWAIWHNRPDTAALAITQGANANPNALVYESVYVSGYTYRVVHGTHLEIAIRNRLRHTDPAARQLALEICKVLLTPAETLRIAVSSSIVEAGDSDLLRCCLPHIADINEWATHSDMTLLAIAESTRHIEIAAILRAAGASLEGTGENLYAFYTTGAYQKLLGDGRPLDYRDAYPGWGRSLAGEWDEWGPVCMLPGIRSGCLCPWCPHEITGGYSVLRRDGW